MDERFSNPWRTTGSRVVYDNAWIRVSEDNVVQPDGSDGIYGVVHFKNKAIGILPIDADGCTYLVGQHRYPLDQYSWEIPEGGCPEGEEPIDTARRELLEETGLEARTCQQMGFYHLSNSVSDEEAIYFLATDLVQREAHPEGCEKLEVLRVPFDEAVRMAMDGEITDALSVVAILRYAMKKS
jgi:8-oxo-dGTP pyrophosphatase MutT (NUDIX family)